MRAAKKMKQHVVGGFGGGTYLDGRPEHPSKAKGSTHGQGAMLGRSCTTSSPSWKEGSPGDTNIRLFGANVLSEGGPEI